jgi:hypothetical protein
MRDGDVHRHELGELRLRVSALPEPGVVFDVAGFAHGHTITYVETTLLAPCPAVFVVGLKAASGVAALHALESILRVHAEAPFVVSHLSVYVTAMVAIFRGEGRVPPVMEGTAPRLQSCRRKFALFATARAYANKILADNVLCYSAIANTLPQHASLRRMRRKHAANDKPPIPLASQVGDVEALHALQVVTGEQLKLTVLAGGAAIADASPPLSALNSLYCGPAPELIPSIDDWLALHSQATAGSGVATDE